jgi:tRNA-dihydrouridine synthase 1
VEKLANNLNIPVTCKVRILPNEKDTMRLVQAIEKAGCSILTVHGRTKEQNKQKVGKCDWNMIKKIKNTLKIPVFANGGIYTFEDAINCLKYTGADAVMSSEALLENPALFSGMIHDMDTVALDYLELSKKYNPDVSQIRGHLFKILYAGLQVCFNINQLIL